MFKNNFFFKMFIKNNFFFKMFIKEYFKKFNKQPIVVKRSLLLYQRYLQIKSLLIFNFIIYNLLSVSYLLLTYKLIFLLIIFVTIILLFNRLSFYIVGMLFSNIWLYININSIILLHSILNFNVKTNFFFYFNINSLYFYQYNVIVYFNKINIVYILIISIISVFANITTLNYMRYDQKKEVFLIILNMFSISMVMLVLTKNLLIILLSWEFLGITSFFLIYHYDLKSISKKSAMKAFSFNRISDLYLMLAAVVYYTILGNFNTNTSNLILFLNDDSYVYFFFFNIKTMYFFLTFISWASIIKSTQLGTHVWLPDSMEAPLPASALIHSATLIAAGFYLILHFYLLYIYHIFYLNIFLFLGLITSVYGSSIAFFQNDLKKILAYSTIGNCGFMLALLSIQDENLYLIYFSLHGLLKSLCFMNCGFFIESFKHSQDNRKKNNFYLKQNKIFFLIIFSISMLGGLPLTFVFFIKHLFFIKFNNMFILLNMLLKLYSIFSILYSINFIYNTIFNYNFFKNNIKFNSNYKFVYYYYIYVFILFLIYKNLNFFNSNIQVNYNIFLENIFYYDIFFILFFFKFCKNYNYFFNNILMYLYLFFIMYYLVKFLY